MLASLDGVADHDEPALRAGDRSTHEEQVALGVGASHGAHRNHRKPGSIGACATPGRVFKGMRMAGRMGTDTVTTQNVTVHGIDTERGLILLKGAVPGPKGGLVVIRSAAKRQEASA